LSEINGPQSQTGLSAALDGRSVMTTGVAQRIGFKVEAYPIQYRTGHRSPFQTGFGLGSNALTLLDAVMKEWMGLAVYRFTDKTSQLFPAP
jgi:hypothetical protein